MTLPELRTTDPLVAILTARGYVFTSTSWTTPVGIDYAWRLVVPRLTLPLILNAPFDEDAFYRIVGEAIARQEHNSLLRTELEGILHHILQNLGTLYAQQERGKLGIVIPNSVRLGEVVLPIQLPDHLIALPTQEKETQP